MSEFWSIILNLVIFVLSLGALVVIHEAGHLTMAKAFKVYCFEFSIGMGPLIYQKKPKKEKGQETAFSVRALPLGGYVSMAGEDMEEAENVDPTIEVPKERTLEAKPRWQRIIVMAAGVFMNFVLGFCLFWIDYGACPQIKYANDSASVEVASSSLVETAGLKSGDTITYIDQTFSYYDEITKTYPSESQKTLSHEVTRYSFDSLPSDYRDLNYSVSSLLGGKFYTSEDGSSYDSYLPSSEYDKRTVTLTYTSEGVSGKKVSVETKAGYSKAYFFSKSSLKWETIGISPTSSVFHYSFAEGLSKAWNMWCYSCSAIFVGLGSLFTPSGWSQIGGIVTIFEVSTVAASSGIASYLALWGMISVNLAIVNLLPFPGLDGWHIVVCLAEYVGLGVKWIKNKISHQADLNKNMSPEELASKEAADKKKEEKRIKTYKKVKQIVSTVGLFLLLGLAVALIVKDIFFPLIG
jgi:regulator of sigma E protease